ncbi:MAG: hypothetical protein RLZZ328_1383 [Bacteroidota bacterium]|jgi:hypothetical protein
MRVIAHRANLNGPDIENENSPDQILKAISAGFDVEVDVRIINGDIFFGHDLPQYKCSEKLLISIIEKAWFHCKNLEAILYLPNKFPGIKYFWHQNDDYALTSNEYIWTYPGKPITKKSIIVLPETIKEEELKIQLENNPYAVCTDWPYKYDARK